MGVMYWDWHSHPLFSLSHSAAVTRCSRQARGTGALVRSVLYSLTSCHHRPLHTQHTTHRHLSHASPSFCATLVLSYIVTPALMSALYILTSFLCVSHLSLLLTIMCMCVCVYMHHKILPSWQVISQM